MFSCARPTHPTIIGKWSGQDKAGNTIAVAFTPEGEYHLQVNHQALIGSTDNHPLQYQVLSSSRKQAEIMLFEDESDLIQGYQALLQAHFQANNRLELKPDNGNQSNEQAILLTRE